MGFLFYLVTAGVVALLALGMGLSARDLNRQMQERRTRGDYPESEVLEDRVNLLIQRAVALICSGITAAVFLVALKEFSRG